MNWRKIRIITWKDLLEVRQNKSVLISMVMVPLIIMVVLPAVMLVVVNSTGSAEALNDPDLQMMFERMPASISDLLAGMNEAQSTVTMILGFLFAPMFLIMPLMLSTSIAAESFAGERERKTLEGLLYTSATDTELFIGKALAAFVPAVLISLVSFLVYTLVLNIGGYPLFGYIWFPLNTWYPLVLWVGPAFAALGVGATVLISARVQTFMGAYQASGSLVILVLGLMVGQASGLIYLSVWVGLVLGFVIWLAAGILFFLAIQQFNRKALLYQSAR
ncbi:MAG: ABC transporter permease subunit [Anaerolineaceae bacterium]|jgi:ABC-type Na+ efflux pump permease subunit|nr:ABC transporter permease subunit [Anaerolineaceae bacterium]